jgi:hypothetical protein
VPQLIYSSMASLDGYVADAGGGFDWAVPDAEVLAFISDLERPVGTYLYGRRLYEMMIGWENDHAVAQRSPRSWKAGRVVVQLQLAHSEVLADRIGKAMYCVVRVLRYRKPLRILPGDHAV